MAEQQFSGWYQFLREAHPQYMAALEDFGKVVRHEGPLDEKTGQLVQLAAAAAIRSEGSVHSHVKRAVAAGATAEEVSHAIILLTSTIGFPSVAAALNWARDVLDKPAS